MSICAALLAFYYVAGYAFGRVRPQHTVFFCMMGAFLCLMCLADDRSFGIQLMTISAAGMLLFDGWMILSNMRPLEKSQPQDGPTLTPQDFEEISQMDVGAIIEESRQDLPE